MGVLGNNAMMQTDPDDIGFWSYGGLPQASQQQGSAAMIPPPPQPAAPPQKDPRQQAGSLGALAQQMQGAPQGAAQPPQAPQAFAGGGRAGMPQSGLLRRLHAPRRVPGYADGGQPYGDRLASLRAIALRGPRPKMRIDDALLEQAREMHENTRGYENLSPADMHAAQQQRQRMLIPRNRIRVGDTQAQTFAGAGPVDGPGTGREDKINALLSDGEYVFDAETVSMLGDGSNKAGAQRLDELREKLRAHKGRTLARGEISPDAKAPEAYLRGGR